MPEPRADPHPWRRGTPLAIKIYSSHIPASTQTTILSRIEYPSPTPPLGLLHLLVATRKHASGAKGVFPPPAGVCPPSFAPLIRGGHELLSDILCPPRAGGSSWPQDRPGGKQRLVTGLARRGVGREVIRLQVQTMPTCTAAFGTTLPNANCGANGDREIGRCITSILAPARRRMI